MNDNIIAGAVSYYQYASDRNNGHYTAFVYDITQSYLYDDMMTKRKIASDDEVAPHLIVYVIGRYTELKYTTIYKDS